MKLSEAIRKGCGMSYGLTHGFLFPQPGEKPCACALGAAFLGVAGAWKRAEVLRLSLAQETRDEGWLMADTHLHLVFGAALEDVKASVPKVHGGSELLPLKEAVIKLNDECGWTRGEIADYLRDLGQ